MGHVPEYAPDLSCRTCRQPYIVTGETPEARAEALATWPGCCPRATPPLLCSFALGRGRYCTELQGHAGDHAPQSTSTAATTEVGETVAEVTAADGGSPSSAANQLARFLAWFRSWPFGAPDYTT